MGDRGGPILGAVALVFALSAEAWSAIGNVVGQMLLVAGSLLTIVVTARLNKGKKQKRDAASAAADEERDEWDRERQRLQQRVTGLQAELEFQTNQVAFGVRERDFEKRKAATAEQEKLEAWEKYETEKGRVERLRRQLRDHEIEPTS